MTMAKTRLSNRIISFILVIVLVFALVVGLPVRARGGVLVPVLGSIALELIIPTVLVGLGIIAASDSSGFDALVERVTNKIQQLHLLPLLITSYIVDGVTHISDEVVKIIAEAANEESAYEPEKVSPTGYIDHPKYGRVYIFDGFSTLKSPLQIPGMVEVKNNLPVGTKITAGNMIYELYQRDKPSFGCTDFISYSFYPDLNYGGNIPPIFYTNAPYYDYPVYFCPLYIVIFTNRPPVFYAGFQYYDFVSTHSWYLTGNLSSLVFNIADYLPDKEICPPAWGVSPYLPSISADGKATALPKEWGNSVPIAGTDVFGLPITVPENPAAAKDLTQDQVQEGSQSGAIDKPIDKPIEEVIDKALEDMKTPPQLIEKFPFSIPFDVIRGVQLLAAPGVAPVFQIPLKVPEYGLDYTWEMDWSRFQELISLVRWGVYLIFLLALAVGTKKLVWG